MATKNFLFLEKFLNNPAIDWVQSFRTTYWLGIMTIAFALSACQTAKKVDPTKTKPKDETSGTSQPEPVVPPPVLVSPEPVEVDAGEPAPPQPTMVLPNQPSARGNRKSEKFGLILSGGGAKAWAHVQVLKELQNHKFPIVAIAGIEWGSVVGAVYAQSLSTSEVEWELNKFKDIDDWDKFVETVFEKKSVSSLKIPFVCASLNLKRQSAYLLNRGMLDQLIPFCLPSAGLVEPFSDGIAAVDHIPALVQHLKASGATKILMVNVLTQNAQGVYIKSLKSMENQFWQMASQSIKATTVDEAINVSLDNYKVDDFSDRKDIMLGSNTQVVEQVKTIAKKYGF